MKPPILASPAPTPEVGTVFTINAPFGPGDITSKPAMIEKLKMS